MSQPTPHLPPPHARASRGICRRCVVWGAIGGTIALGLFDAAARAQSSPAREFVVIVNRQNTATSVSREFVADAFLKKASHWDDGQPIKPVDQSAASPVRRAFSTSVVKRTVGAVRSYWQQRIFSGRDLPPPELDSDDAVIHYVAKYPGGVGYVSPSAKLDDIAVLAIR
jgi:ABC-type phosphate transport system substrate-binding protein